MKIPISKIVLILGVALLLLALVLQLLNKEYWEWFFLIGLVVGLSASVIVHFEK